MSHVEATSIPQTLASKTLSDVFMGNTFQSLSATQRSVILTASTKFEVDSLVEIGAAFSLQIPSTSSLEITGYVTTGGTQILANKTVASPVLTGTATWPNNYIPGNALSSVGSTPAIFSTNNYQQITASPGTFSVETTIFTAVGITIPAGGRSAEITIVVPQISSSVTGDRVGVRIKESSTIVQQFYIGMPANGWGGTLKTLILTPSVATHTYTVTCTRDVGTGVITWYADTNGATSYAYATLL